jgi:hypothetical protein
MGKHNKLVRQATATEVRLVRGWIRRQQIKSWLWLALLVLLLLPFSVILVLSWFSEIPVRGILGALLSLAIVFATIAIARHLYYIGRSAKASDGLTVYRITTTLRVVWDSDSDRHYYKTEFLGNETVEFISKAVRKQATSGRITVEAVRDPLLLVLNVLSCTDRTPELIPYTPWTVSPDYPFPASSLPPIEEERLMEEWERQQAAGAGPNDSTPDDAESGAQGRRSKR